MHQLVRVPDGVACERTASPSPWRVPAKNGGTGFIFTDVYAPPIYLEAVRNAGGDVNKAQASLC